MFKYFEMSIVFFSSLKTDQNFDLYFCLCSFNFYFRKIIYAMINYLIIHRFDP